MNEARSIRKPVVAFDYIVRNRPLVDYALELVQLVTGVSFEQVDLWAESFGEDLWIRPRFESGHMGDWMRYSLSNHWKLLARVVPMERELELGIADRLDGLPDWLLSMVWMALRVEEREAPVDVHGRVDSRFLIGVKRDQQHFPWVHIWAKSFLSEWGEVSIRRFKPEVEISVDIDHLLAYAGRTWGHVILAAGRDLMALQWKKVCSRLRAKGGGEDVYDTFNLQQSLWLGHPWRYFALVQLERNERDTGVDATSERAQRLWRALDAAMGSQLGWHPSTMASAGMEEGLLHKEYEQIVQVLQRHVYATRFHFLAFSPHKMYPVLAKMGIKSDHSMGFVDCMGWRAGLGVPFPWFDLESNRRLDLWIHPFYAMDGHLLYYEKSENPFDQWFTAADHCAVQQVPFSWVTHWRMFSEQASEWKGWIEFVRKLQRWYIKN